VSFADAVNRTLAHEGGHVNDPRDPGGETKWGISQRAYPHLDIASLTLEQARAIYRRDYWDAMRCDQLPDRIAAEVFDAAVNSGRRSAAVWLQRALGVNADGVIGPITLRAAREADPAVVAARILGYRLSHMTDLSNWPHHGRGWARRIAANLIGE
jgi:lysozyme family protein